MEVIKILIRNYAFIVMFSANYASESQAIVVFLAVLVTIQKGLIVLKIASLENTNKTRLLEYVKYAILYVKLVQRQLAYPVIMEGFYKTNSV